MIRDNILGTKEAAAILGVSQARIRQLIGKKKIAAEKVGNTHLIRESALAGLKTYGKPGRPKKEKPEGAQ